MKPATFERTDGLRPVGAVDAGAKSLLDLGRASQIVLGQANASQATMQALIEAGEAGFELARMLIERAPPEAVSPLATANFSHRCRVPNRSYCRVFKRHRCGRGRIENRQLRTWRDLGPRRMCVSGIPRSPS